MELANIAVEVALILGNIANLDAMTTAQLTIKNIVDRLGIPKNYRTAGFTHRLFAWNQYRLQQGLIMLIQIDHWKTLYSVLNLMELLQL